PLDQIDALLAGHLKEAKLTLAKTVITEYHDAPSAEEAAQRWQQEIGGSALPADIPVVTLRRSDLGGGQVQAAQLLKLAGLCASTSDARRSIGQGGAYLGEDKQRIESHDQRIAVEPGLLLWVGKKRYCRVEIEE